MTSEIPGARARGVPKIRSRLGPQLEMGESRRIILGRRIDPTRLTPSVTSYIERQIGERAPFFPSPEKYSDCD